MKAWLLMGMLAIVGLAGCAEEAPPPQEDETGIDDDLEATSTTGVIRGVVVDETITPVAGATIDIVGEDLSTESNEDGEFGFSDLAPGLYFLNVDKIGYDAVSTSTSVEAGVDRPPIVNVRILSNPEDSPSYEVFKFEGFLQCSASAGIGGNFCSLLDITGQPIDQPLVEQPLAGQPDYLQSEMVWESTQPAGDKLALMYSWDSPDCDPFLCDHEAEGTSPILLRMEAEGIDEAGFGSSQNLTIRVFNRGLDETGGLVGATFEQRFTVFTVAFYGFTPDDSYRFEADGEPVVPS